MTTFAEIWPLTSKVGRKELFAKKWQKYSRERKEIIFERVKLMKVKPNPEDIIK